MWGITNLVVAVTCTSLSLNVDRYISGNNFVKLHNGVYMLYLGFIQMGGSSPHNRPRTGGTVTMVTRRLKHLFLLVVAAIYSDE